MRVLRKWLILSHRYLGIALSLVFVMWFASGIVMIYAGGMPRLTPEARRARMPALDFARVRLGPVEAAARAGLDAPPSATLLSVMDRPAYRFGGRAAATVFADTGELLRPAGREAARAIAGRFLDVPDGRLRHVGELTRPDQWTIALGRSAGLQKFELDDDAGTQVYVSPRTGDVALATTRRERALAWVGVIPHWMYFTPLRLNQPLWYRVVVWTSGICCVVAVLGLVLGVTQFRRAAPFSLARSIPYAGWMRWHYLTGIVFGVFALTWAFSGLLSMEPFAWTNATGLEVADDVFTGGPLELSRFPATDPGAWSALAHGGTIKEVEFVRIQDAPFFVVHRSAAGGLPRAERLHQPYNVSGRAEPDRLLVSAATMRVQDAPFTVDSLVGRLKTALPDVRIVEQQLLTEYDAYYYSRARQTPLPVLRVKFDDPMQTWFYVDPGMSRLLGTVHRLNRVERWLYNGLHSLDFSFWYTRRPLWDIGVIGLCLGGLATSAIGALLGVRRLRRGLRSAVGAPLPGSRLARDGTASS